MFVSRTRVRDADGNATSVTDATAARPDRDRPGPVDDALETRSQRIRHHLQRPIPGC
jgi:hypothetical protein